jgi:hypothetical protein
MSNIIGLLLFVALIAAIIGVAQLISQLEHNSNDEPH